jgi:light-harvesting complex I chlorophyll a/b binding protein 1
LSLAKDEASLDRFTESELIHCRWAMLGAAGVIGVEALGFGSWADAPTWVSAEFAFASVALSRSTLD